MDRNRKLSRNSTSDDQHEERHCGPGGAPVLSRTSRSSGLQEEQDSTAERLSETDLDDSDLDDSDSSNGVSKTDPVPDTGGVRVYRCTQCDQSFGRWQQLELHARRHIGEQRLRCHLCDRRFRLQAQLKHHLNTHLAQKPFVCACCGKAFLQKSSLRYHQLIHAGAKPYGCSRCGRAFRSTSHRKGHMCAADRKKPGKARKLCCSECGEMFASRSLLLAHERIHQGKELFTCGFCGLHLLFRSCLEKHLRGHTGERPFGCTACHKRFRWASQIKKHKCAPPLDPRKHGCLECSEAFPTKAQLLVHLQGHRGKKLYTCSVCGLQRRFKSQLDLHMRSHTGEKPFSCNVCGKRFTQMCFARQHQLAHAKEKPFSCSDCSRRFSWRFQIRKHRCQASGRCGSHIAFRPHTNQMSKPASEPTDGEFQRQTQQVRSRFTYQRKKELFGGHVGTQDPDQRVTPETCTKSSPPEFQTWSGMQESRSPIERNGIRWVGPEPDRTKRHSDINNPTSSSSDKLHEEQPHIKEEPQGAEIRCSTPGVHRPAGAVRAEDGEPPQSCEHRAELWTGCSGQVDSGRSGCSEELLLHRPASPPGSALGSRDQLTVHAAVHVSCSMCNSTFSDTDTLMQHMRSHASQTQFSCSVCFKDFTWRRHLTRHMELHSGEELHQAQLQQRRKGFCRTNPGWDESVHVQPGPVACGSAPGPGSGPDRPHWLPDSDDSTDSDFWKEQRILPVNSPLSTGEMAEVKQEDQEEPCPVKEEPLEAQISRSSYSLVHVQAHNCGPAGAVHVKPEEEEEEKPFPLLLHHLVPGAGPGPEPSESSETDVSDEDWTDRRGTRTVIHSEVGPAEHGHNMHSEFWKDDW